MIGHRLWGRLSGSQHVTLGPDETLHLATTTDWAGMPFRMRSPPPPCCPPSPCCPPCPCCPPPPCCPHIWQLRQIGKGCLFGWGPVQKQLVHDTIDICFGFAVWIMHQNKGIIVSLPNFTLRIIIGKWLLWVAKKLDFCSFLWIGNWVWSSVVTLWWATVTLRWATGKTSSYTHATQTEGGHPIVGSWAQLKYSSIPFPNVNWKCIPTGPFIENYFDHW